SALEWLEVVILRLLRLLVLRLLLGRLLSGRLGQLEREDLTRGHGDLTTDDDEVVEEAIELLGGRIVDRRPPGHDGAQEPPRTVEPDETCRREDRAARRRARRHPGMQLRAERPIRHLGGAPSSRDALGDLVTDLVPDACGL